MASRKFYAYYLRGDQISLIEQDYAYGDGQTLGQPSLDDIGPSGGYLWKSPLETVADGLEIEYTYSPSYFIKETEDTNTALDTYKSTNGYLVLEDAGNDDFSASPESLADGSYIVLKNAGRWNGLHKVSAAGTGSITTYTKYSGDGTTSVAFEETVTLYYNVDVLNNEADTIDLPTYLSKALVYYVKAKIAEDQLEIDAKQYFMKEFYKMLEKHENSKVWGQRIVIPGTHAIR